jgi:DNA-binding HxlR family transcriptional regulator
VLVQRTRFGDMSCSIARTLHVAGEPWSPLIMRDVWVGITRFDDLQRDLGISRKVLAERLRWLVGQRMLKRRTYSERPKRLEYVLTDKGLEFCDVLVAMTSWGDRWTADDAPPALLRHRACGEVTRPELHCPQCGETLQAADLDVEAGPGAAITSC